MRKSRTTLNKDSNTSFKIIAIDDVSIALDSLEYIFKRDHNYYFLGFTDVEAAIEALEKEKFDVLILDYMLVNTNGKEVIERIRNTNSINKYIPIIILTGYPKDLTPLDAVKGLDILGYAEKDAHFNNIMVELEKVKRFTGYINDSSLQSKKTLGQRIRYLRENAGISQKELSDKLNIGRTTVVSYEQDNNEPSVDMLKKIASIFHVSVDFLVGYIIDTDGL